MTKHKHAEIIKAKADNMELAVFCKGINDGCEWHEVKRFPNWQDNASYFLCLPQHNEHGQCLAWLNGGDLQYSHDGVGFSDLAEQSKWDPDSAFMDSNLHIRIKPSKEKRWIAHFKYGDRFRTTQFSYETIEQLKVAVHAPDGFDNWQFIEIEVEV